MLPLELAFHTALARVEKKWDNPERSCLSDGHEPAFSLWFQEYKVEDIIHCALPEVRLKAGLSDPSFFFYY